MARLLPKTIRTRWIGLCGVVSMMGAVVVACAGPASLSTNNSNTGGTGGRGGTGGWGGKAGNTSFVPLTVPMSFGLDGSSPIHEGPTEVDGGNCGVTAGNLARQDADLLLVLDRSSSMTFGIDSGNQCNVGDPNCTARWATMTTALDQVLTTSPTSVNWGLKFFPSPDAQTNCTVNPGVDAEIPASPADIQTAIVNTAPGKQTPTKAAINAAVAYFSTLNDGRSHNILLATDGQPNCDDGSSGSVTAAAARNTEAAIAAAAADGVKTYVIGIGPSTGNLDNFARAGGTMTHFPATSPDQLISALNSVAQTVASCTFTLKPLPLDPDNVVVEFNGDRNLRAPRDPKHTSGWDYTSASHNGIELYGPWCDNVTNETYKSIKILMGCPNRPIP